MKYEGGVGEVGVKRERKRERERGETQEGMMNTQVLISLRGFGEGAQDMRNIEMGEEWLRFRRRRASN